MVKKVPPPPFLTGPEWAGFNRWLIELTSLLSNEGNIDPEQVAGLPAVIAQVGVNTADIAALTETVELHSADIVTLQANITTLQDTIIAVENRVTALEARGEILNGTVDPGAGLGKVSDWYANTAGAAGHRIFVKTGAATWTAFPF